MRNLRRLYGTAGNVLLALAGGHQSAQVPPADNPTVSHRLDWLILVFFLVNLLFITYQVDLEQLVIADPYHFTYPLWPPGPVVDAVHWWDSSFDPLVMARPTWWKMTPWIDVLFFGPFYATAVFMFLTRRAWPRIPAIFWAAAMLTVVTVIMGEEVAGPHRTSQLAVVALANAAWVAVPLLVLLRMGLHQVDLIVTREPGPRGGSG